MLNFQGQQAELTDLECGSRVREELLFKVARESEMKSEVNERSLTLNSTSHIDLSTKQYGNY